MIDEQPVRDRRRARGRIVSVPYTVEINDVVISAVQQQPSDEILRRGRDQFDRLYLEAQEAPRVMAISIHPYLTGVPHRIKYLETLYDYILGHDGVVHVDGRGDPRLVSRRDGEGGVSSWKRPLGAYGLQSADLQVRS